MDTKKKEKNPTFKSQHCEHLPMENGSLIENSYGAVSAFYGGSLVQISGRLLRLTLSFKNFIHYCVTQARNLKFI